MRTLRFLCLLGFFGISANVLAEEPPGSMSATRVYTPKSNLFREFKAVRARSGVSERVEANYPSIDPAVLNGRTKVEIESARVQAATELARETMGIAPNPVLALYSMNAYLRGASEQGAWTEQYNFTTLTSLTHSMLELEAALVNLQDRNESLAFVPKLPAQKVAQMKRATKGLVDFIEANSPTMKDSPHMTRAQATTLATLLGDQESGIDGTFTYLNSLQSFYFDRFMHPEAIGARVQFLEEIAVAKKSPTSKGNGVAANNRPKADAYIVITSGESKPNDPRLVAYFKHEMAVSTGYQQYISEHFEELLAPLPGSSSTLEYQSYTTLRKSIGSKELRHERFLKRLEELELKLEKLDLGEQVNGEVFKSAPEGEAAYKELNEFVKRAPRKFYREEKYQ